MKNLVIGENSISIDDVWAVAHQGVFISLSEEVKKSISDARRVVEESVRTGKVIYGVNTGFGDLKDKHISYDQIGELQENLIRSHAIGVGEPYNETEVRAMMFVRLISLAHGYSGIRLELAELLVEFLNRNVIPYVPSQGSVGASGDLAPLSHIALSLMGEGRVIRNGRVLATADLLNELGIRPIRLKEKEGLALNNGTAAMTGIAALNIKRAELIAVAADVTGAISLEVMMGTLTAYHDDIQNIRPHRGQGIVAKNFQALCAGSGIMESHRNCDRIQDSYSLRCTPQVHGAIRDTLAHCKMVVETELNSTTDNPLVFPAKGEIISGGNFHGEPIALVMDFLAIAISEYANIAERRIFKMLTPGINQGLPPFLIASQDLGLNNGFMIAQYTAASLVAENKYYAHPVSVDSIPTSANQEDHVSFGTIAANKCRRILDNVENVLAIELLCGCQAADLRRPLTLGEGTQAAYDHVRGAVRMLGRDREISGDVAQARKMIRTGSLIRAIADKGPALV